MSEIVEMECGICTKKLGLNRNNIFQGNMICDSCSETFEKRYYRTKKKRQERVRNRNRNNILMRYFEMLGEIEKAEKVDSEMAKENTKICRTIAGTLEWVLIKVTRAEVIEWNNRKNVESISKQ